MSLAVLGLLENRNEDNTVPREMGTGENEEAQMATEEEVREDGCMTSATRASSL